MTEFLKINANFNIKEYTFDSGNEELNFFIFQMANDFIKEEYTQVYVLKKVKENYIIGYFTLSCCQIEFNKDLYSIEEKTRYIPGLLIGQLAIDKECQNKNFGTYLLTKAIEIGFKISNKVGCRLMIVDASTDLKIIGFYGKLNFKFVRKGLGEKVVGEL